MLVELVFGAVPVFAADQLSKTLALARLDE
jgi:hypothetical protein